MGFDHLAHIVILILDGQRDHPFTILLLEQIDHTLQIALFGLELLARVVTDDIFRCGLLHGTVHSHQMVETVILFGMFGTLGCRQKGVDFANHLQGVDHFVLGIPRMDISTLYGNFGTCGIEVFVLQLPFETAIHRIGEIGPEIFNIEEVHSTSHLLVGCKSDTYRTVRDFGVCHQVFSGCHNFSNSGLVIGPQQRGTVGRDQGMSFEKGQFREFGHTHGQRFVQTNILPIVIIYKLGFDLHPGHIGAGIDMRDKSDYRFLFATGCSGDCTGHISVRIDLHIGKSHNEHLL